LTEDIDTRRRRAAFRASHRGTKEMDFLLGRFAEAKLPSLDGPELDRFEQLLAIADPELQGWILAPKAGGSTDFADLILDVRRFHGLD